MNNRTVIGSRINSALAFSNKKQKELASHLGVPDNTISYFCSGKRVPNAEQIIEISKFLGVSSDYLLGLTESKPIDEDIKIVSAYTGLDDKAIAFIKKIKEEGYINSLNDFLSGSNIIHLLENMENSFEIIENFLNDTEVFNEVFKEFVDDMSNNPIMKIALYDKHAILSHISTACRFKYKDELDYAHYRCQKEMEDILQTIELMRYYDTLDNKAEEIYVKYLKYCEETEAEQSGEHNPSEE